MAWWFDGPLLSILTHKWDKAAIANYPERISQHEQSIPAPIASALQTIDSKATGLLTHASMMIAGLGLIAPLVASNRIEEGVVVIEMLVYLLIAIGCLRCLTVFNPQNLTDDTGETIAHLGHELLLRRELYALCVRVAIVFTVLVVVTLPVLFIW